MEELQESELGKQEYWDKRYQEEISNFEDHGDCGEIWFGEDTVERILQWLEKNEIHKDSSILDIGCGNGMFLVDLAENGFTKLVGVDYSEDGIQLAKSIAKKRNLKINFLVTNILENFEGRYDIIHDKGTYDAISLSATIKEDRMKYLRNVHEKLNDSGFFIITSCNWTTAELEEQFKEYFEKVGIIPAPQFKFGGKTGSTVSSLIFAKKKK